MVYQTEVQNFSLSIDIFSYSFYFAKLKEFSVILLLTQSFRRHEKTSATIVAEAVNFLQAFAWTYSRVKHTRGITPWLGEAIWANAP